ncbi:type 2 lanthipeptide synthetase LanM family protein [Kitasatospora sp. CM 4170]|uniref:type 2 lanthipeptide synthetase LanM family protein n=1 Tax=Kitasatospora TaxID=2063 RepID=UPI0028A8B2F9|nr:type 2 lanthipeptide synthetase LanM family protein [Kitasatospora sp. CM 4170]WNM43250.1 type 2 lanthipeptide synthetase LanM family protein [Kitasatospora sp. CM 4170]
MERQQAIDDVAPPAPGWWTRGVRPVEAASAPARSAAGMAPAGAPRPAGAEQPAGAGTGPLPAAQPPAWAEYAERALAAAPLSAPRPAAGEDWEEAFGRVCAPFAEVAGERFALALAAPGPAADTALLRRAFTTRLTTRLTRLAARCLVAELAAARERGELSGATPQERFADFVRNTAGRAGLTRLLVRYPVLARLLAQACQQSVDAESELVRRLAEDRARLVTEVLDGRDPGRLTAVDVKGDAHRHGRAVAVLRFADGTRLVYKPRPVAAHRHFNALLAWVGAALPEVAPRALRLLDRGTHGWVEYAEAAPCRTPAQVELFYRRLGVLTAVLHALNATDMHCENLIACADHPVLIDLETLFHPVTAAPPDADGTSDSASDGTSDGAHEADPAQLALDHSVLRIALLPSLVYGPDGGWDVSGLGGGRGGELPLAAAGWAQPGTDRMHLARRPARFAEAANRPVLDGAAADPARYADSLVAGFRAGYDLITERRAELTAPGGPVRAFADAELRVVLRPTRLYGVLLDELTDPGLLRDAAERDLALDGLESVPAPGGEGLRPGAHERADLWAGDVPLFTHRPRERAVQGGPTSGERAGDLAAPALDQVLTKIAGMGAVDRYDQEWIIRAALATGAPAPGTATLPAPGAAPSATAAVNAGRAAPSPEQLVTAARNLADTVLAGAFPDERRVNWLGPQQVRPGQWAVLPLGAALAGGYTGTAVFLAQLADLTDADRYAEAARRAVTALPGLLDHLAARPDLRAAAGCGAAHGLGGLAYALTHLAALLADQDLAALIEPAVTLAVHTAERTEDLTVAGGLAGCLATLDAVHRHTALPAAARGAALCAERLTAAAPATLPAGFAHGAHGVGWALARHVRGLGDSAGQTGATDPTGATGHTALATAARLLAQPVDLPDHSWSHGLSGAAFALTDGLGAADAPGTADDLAEPGPPAQSDSPDRVLRRPDLLRAVRAAADAGPLPDHSLALGETGRLELLAAAARVGLPGAGQALADHTGRLLVRLTRGGPRCAVPAGTDSPDLMNGLAGIGHGLLRRADAGRVPSLAALQPPRSR